MHICVYIYIYTYICIYIYIYIYMIIYLRAAGLAPVQDDVRREVAGRPLMPMVWYGIV